MRALTVTIGFALSARVAEAHGGAAHGSHGGWTFDPWIVTPLGFAALLYAAGSWTLLRGKKTSAFIYRSSLFFWMGWIVLVAALVSPLHFLGEHLFTFHMIEHELVMALAAPLIVLARPIGVFFWGLPQPVRHGAMKLVKAPAIQAAWTVATAGTVATLSHGLAIWAWHAPSLFDATVRIVLLHRLQHLSFFVTAVFFWWAVVWKLDRGAAAWHLFVTMMHTGVLGALIALAPHVLYPAQTVYAPDWGLTPLEDQQLAGIVMWVPGGIVYAGAAMAALALWISGSSRRRDHVGSIG